jgi:hypothetical protein
MEKTHTCIPSQNNYLYLGVRLEIRDLAEHARHANAIAIASMSVRITVKAAFDRQWGAININRKRPGASRETFIAHALEKIWLGRKVHCRRHYKARRCPSALHHVATWLLFKQHQLPATLPTVQEMRVICTDSRSKPDSGKAMYDTGLKFGSYHDTCLNFRRMSHALRM